MTKTPYWLRNPADGNFALADGAEQRDQLMQQGLVAADEPRETDHVWMWHDGIEQPGRIPYGARDYWQATGWTLGRPPAPVDLTRDPALTDSAPAAPVEPDPELESKTSGKPAAETVKKER